MEVKVNDYTSANLKSTEWRSQDANSDFGLDDSIASTINSSFLSSNTQKDANSSLTSEEGLLNALNNLSIESVEKPRRSSRSDPNLDSSYEDCQDLSSNTQIDLSINNTVIHDPSHSADDKKFTGDQISDIPISVNSEVTQNNSLTENDNTKEETTCSQVIDTPTNEHQECVSGSQTTSDNTGEQKNTTQDVINDMPINSDSKAIPDADQKNMNSNINKSAVLNQSTKKNKPASPSLLPKPKPRTVDSSILDQSVSKVTKPAAKHVIKTITDASDGAHLKEERINHFGIPVISGRKKHIEAQPFNFLARGKSNSITSKTSDTKQVGNKTLNATSSKIMNKTIGGTTDKTMNKTLGSASDKLVNKTLTAKRISNVPSRVMDKTIKKPSVLNTTRSSSNAKISTKVNQENKTPNVIPKPKIQAPKPSRISGPPKLHTDKRAKERHEFDVQIRQKQLEIDRLRMMWEEKQREKEKLEELALRKTMEPRAHPMPEFKAPVPIKSSKALTVPQSPATWANNHKK
ncbi:Protein of unknown function [Cotesia congregata]|uniref:TPX2 C-terminal domain-containing protein n=1 Tax=Cotesia congregata TaxID=51543 RepID=A0A8J2HU64_COTCN|nr:Protein of unknown function [Cotesia congregata]